MAYTGGGYYGGTTAANVFKKDAGEAKVLKDRQAAAMSGTAGDLRDIPFVSGALQTMLNRAPSYQGVRDADGDLKENYRFKRGSLNTGGVLSGIARDVRDVDRGSVRDVQAGTVGSGADFAQGRQNLSRLQERAFGTGVDQWTQALLDKQQAEQSMARDGAEQQADAAAAGMMDSLARSGGLEGGSRERALRNASRDKMFARQGVARDGQMSRLGLLSNMEQQRAEMQMKMPEMNLAFDSYNTGLQRSNRDAEMEAAKANQGIDFNVQSTNADLGMRKAGLLSQGIMSDADRNFRGDLFNREQGIRDQNRELDWKKDDWKTAITGVGADRTAEATANAGKKRFLGIF